MIIEIQDKYITEKFELVVQDGKIKGNDVYWFSIEKESNPGISITLTKDQVKELIEKLNESLKG